VVVEDVEDLDLVTVSEGPVGDIGLPALLGQLGGKRRQELFGRFWGWRVMKPRRDRTRQMVATDGTARLRRRWRRCRW
jgi:hypothetical protein